MKISQVFLYDEPSVPEIDIKHISDFIKELFGIDVKIQKNILSFGDDTIAERIASCRVFNPRRPFQRHYPTQEEIQFEVRNESDSATTENIIMYDGFEFQNIISELIPKEEQTFENLHIAFTNKLMCTYDYNDYRYHGRALIGSNPSIISTTGIIEAPAKPREYYMELISNMTQGLNLESVKRKYSGRYLEYHDKRLDKIVEGYVLQAMFYYITGEAFCDSLECRLHNAHWQKDLLYSQLEVGRFCDKHQRILENL
ncbi:hypothetical protein C6988_07250 [Nitrosopumilus sp. b1]|uniref:DUF6775 family putative metallopeptidase n=1 Tax=Nitrosopumilus sp. b1 TaxID=2109907 RepID=UPI0015F76900|nr:DUF6775 family putative metallopeptidase [Nitrosopumilus sp. b1]KAF6242956.1 hypothetical protein C6988_07250 [Nitrosopumilus sp. b1]